MKTDLHCWIENRTPTRVPSTEAFERWLDPAKTAIACIDMHRGPRRARGRADAGCAPCTRADPGAQRVPPLAREIGIPVIHVQHWQRYGGIDDANSQALNSGANWRVLSELYLPPNPLMLEHSWEGTKWLDLMVERRKGDYYVRTKKRLSAFYPTDFEFLLHQLDVKNLVITGTLTECCDLSTAFDAANRDFRVLIPRDIVAGSSAEAEHAALIIISLHLGLVVDSPALLAEWYARAGKELPRELVRRGGHLLDPAGTPWSVPEAARRGCLRKRTSDRGQPGRGAAEGESRAERRPAGGRDGGQRRRRRSGRRSTRHSRRSR